MHIQLLPEIMYDDIFDYLSSNELNNSSLVNKAFFHAAGRARRRRGESVLTMQASYLEDEFSYFVNPLSRRLSYLEWKDHTKDCDYVERMSKMLDLIRQQRLNIRELHLLSEDLSYLQRFPLMPKLEKISLQYNGKVCESMPGYDFQLMSILQNENLVDFSIYIHEGFYYNSTMAESEKPNNRSIVKMSLSVGECLDYFTPLFQTIDFLKETITICAIKFICISFYLLNI